MFKNQQDWLEFMFVFLKLFFRFHQNMVGMLVIAVYRRLRQEEHAFNASLGYIVRSLKKKKK